MSATPYCRMLLDTVYSQCVVWCSYSSSDASSLVNDVFLLSSIAAVDRATSSSIGDARDVR